MVRDPFKICQEIIEHITIGNAALPFGQTLNMVFSHLVNQTVNDFFHWFYFKGDFLAIGNKPIGCCCQYLFNSLEECFKLMSALISKDNIVFMHLICYLGDIKDMISDSFNLTDASEIMGNQS